MNIVVLRRRLFYICAMVVLLVPLYFLGNPSVREPDGSVKQPGGTLAQIRTAYDLGQGDLGEIDPASESMRLATLGLRGVAATILWQKAEYYKKEQFWDRLSATLNQIAVLQPHFVEVWEFQSHNLSYNVSAEFDDYRQRYQWVKRGIDYLIKGSKFNKRRTEMPFELGQFFGSKMGVADEKKQFRALYRDDENFHKEVFDRTGLDLRQPDGMGPDRKPDNWLSGRLWYLKAYQMVDAGSAPARSAMMFYLKGPQWLMKYAEALQTEGTLDEPARYAWRTADRDWKEFGERNIVTTFGDTIYLTELERANADYQKLREEFETFSGEAFQKLRDERIAKLTPEEIAAWTKPAIERTFNEILMAERADGYMSIPPLDIAKASPPEKRVEALQLAKRLETAKEKISHVEIYRNQINYPYWAERCKAEQEDSAILARTSMYEANQLLDRGELDAAIDKYDVAWNAWADLFNKFPAMMIDDAADEVLQSIERYRRLLDQPDLPPDFGLSGFLKFRELRESDLADPAIMNVIGDWRKVYPDRDFVTELLRKSSEAEEASAPDATDDGNVTSDSAASVIEVTAPDEGGAPAPKPKVDAPAVNNAESAQSVPPAQPESTNDSQSSSGASAEINIEQPAEGTAPSPKAE